MKIEAQNIAIAEACGVITFAKGSSGEQERFHFRGDFLPSYTTDLNAMHEAEKVLKSWGEYEYSLRRMLDQQFVVHATAAQRAEAFLRTIGKWED